MNPSLHSVSYVWTATGEKKRKFLLVWFWYPYFGMPTVFNSSITLSTLRKVELLIAHISLRYLCVWMMESRIFLHQGTVSEVVGFDAKISRIELRIASLPIVFSGSGSQWRLPACMISEIDTYFESKDKSSYEKEFKCYRTDCITLWRDFYD